MPWLDPPRVRDALAHLRAVADRADDVERDIRRHLTMADLGSMTAARLCREIDEELSDLAVIIDERLALAEGHLSVLPGNWASVAERHLLDSLLDDVGARAEIGGDIALDLVIEHQLLTTIEHPISEAGGRVSNLTIVTRASLEAMAADGTVDRATRAACRNLLDDPAQLERLRDTGDRFHDRRTAELPDDAFAIDTARFLRRRNEALARMAGAASNRLGSSEIDRFTEDDLASFGLSRSDLNELDLPIDFVGVIAASIDNGTFLHSTSAARQFVLDLPVHARDGHGLPVNLVDPNALRSLHRVATADLDVAGSEEDQFTWMMTSIHLPETDGIRAQLIAKVHAQLHEKLDLELNGSLAAGPGAPGHSGANFFTHSTNAAGTVARILADDERLFGVIGYPPGIKQDLADGGQAIAYDMVVHAQERSEGRPISDPSVAAAFAFYDAARRSTDPLERQTLTLQGNLAIAFHEQRVVDPYLEFPNVGRLLRAGSRVITFVLDNAVGSSPTISTPRGSGGRSFNELQTDMNELDIRDADGNELAPPVRLGEPIQRDDSPSNLVAGLDLCEIADPIFCSDGSAPRSWSEDEDRMPPIGSVMQAHHTDPALFAVAASFLDERHGR